MSTILYNIGYFVINHVILFALAVAVVLVVINIAGRVSVEDNPILMDLYRNVARGEIDTLYISDDTVFYNFDIVTLTPETYTGELSQAKIERFHGKRYKKTTVRQLEQYREKFLDKVKTLPGVREVTKCYIHDFQPESVLARYTRDRKKKGTAWIFTYQELGDRATEPLRGKRIG